MRTRRSAALAVIALSPYLIASCTDIPEARAPVVVRAPSTTSTIDRVAVLRQIRNVQKWNDTVRWNDVARLNAAIKNAEAARRTATHSPRREGLTDPDRPAPTVSAPSWPASYQPCGGAYPPCWRVRTESGGNYNAFNPHGCGGRGCYGKWQFSGAWACKLGLPCDIAHATPAQQDEAARILWDGGRGCSHWAAC